MAFLSTQKVRFDDVDGAGIVYYPRFFHMCHKAFEDFFDETGPIKYPEIISKLKRGFPTVRTEGEYTGPLKYGDLAQIKIAIEYIGNTSFRTRYDVTRTYDQVLCFRGLVTTVHVDLETFRPLPIEGALRAFLEGHRL